MSTCKLKYEHSHYEYKLIIKIRLYFKSSFNDHFDKQKIQFENYLAILLSYSSFQFYLMDCIYLSVNYITNKWPNNLQFGWFFARIIFKNKSKRWTVSIIELCILSICQDKDVRIVIHVWTSTYEDDWCILIW